VQCMHVLV